MGGLIHGSQSQTAVTWNATNQSRLKIGYRRKSTRKLLFIVCKDKILIATVAFISMDHNRSTAAAMSGSIFVVFFFVLLWVAYFTEFDYDWVRPYSLSTLSNSLEHVHARLWTTISSSTSTDCHSRLTLLYGLAALWIDVIKLKYTRAIVSFQCDPFVYFSYVVL